MSGPLNVQTEGLRNFSQTHAGIASGVSQLVSGGPAPTGVETTHGPIAMAVQSALSEVLGSRTGTLRNTASSGSTISELLSKAAQMYDDGDREGAAKAKAAAEAMSQGQGAAGAPASTGGGGGGLAGQMTGILGQMMGQLGQVGQMGQQGGGVLQGLQQVPQQVMAGVQQIVEAATGTAGDVPVSKSQEPNGQGVPPGVVGPAVGGALGGAPAQDVPAPPKGSA